MLGRRIGDPLARQLAWRRVKRVLALLAVAIAVLAAPAASALQLPPLPGLGQPSNVAKFRLVFDAAQLSTLKVDGDNYPGKIPGCAFSFQYELHESWKPQRGKGTTIAFERLGPVVELGRIRGGAFSPDASFDTVGTVYRDAYGAFSETGPPSLGCRGVTKVDQTDCGKHFTAHAPLQLLWNGHALTIQAGSKAVTLKDPTAKCGNSPFGSLSAQYGYAHLISVKLAPLSKRVIFGHQRVITLKVYRSLEADQPGPVSGHEDAYIDGDIKLIRVS